MGIRQYVWQEMESTSQTKSWLSKGLWKSFYCTCQVYHAPFLSHGLGLYVLFSLSGRSFSSLSISPFFPGQNWLLFLISFKESFLLPYSFLLSHISLLKTFWWIPVPFLSLPFPLWRWLSHTTEGAWVSSPLLSLLWEHTPHSTEFSHFSV